MVTVVDRLVQALDLALPPRSGHVVCHSSPDLDDTILALLATTPPCRTVTVLADEPSIARRRLVDLQLPAVPVRAKRGVRGLAAYLRSEHAVTTHGVFGSLPRGKRKTSSTPWHGELSKQIGRLIGRPGKHFDMLAVSSLQSKILRVAEFGVSPESVQVIGVPRQVTLLRSPRSKTIAAVKQDERWVLFVPTYRRSQGSAVQIDNEISVEEQEASLTRLDATVRDHGAVLWVRPHPVADAYDNLPTTIRMATDDRLQSLGLTFYDMLGACDVLVTDYSSVWVDFLLTDKPVVGFCPDIEDYRASRGLALEPYDAWFPGPVTRTTEDLCRHTGAVLAGDDGHREKRAWVRSLVCPPRPDPAAAYWSALSGR